MTNKDLMIAFGAIDADLILEAAPSARFVKEKRASTQPQNRDKPRVTGALVKLGALAAAIILLIAAVPILIDQLQGEDIVINEYNDVITQCDIAILGTYKGKTEYLTYSEYTFEVTELLKGELTQKEITVRSEKKSVFSDDEMEKYAKSANSSFKVGDEYYLTLQSGADEIMTFISEQIVAVNDLGNLDSVPTALAEFFENYGITVKTTREELIEFFDYIFGAAENEGFDAQPTEGLEFKLTGEGYRVTGYTGKSRYVTVPSEYNGLPVTGIDPNAFQKNLVIKSVHLPDSIEYIGAVAFRSCQNLASINIPKNVKTIGSNTFSKCIRLINVDIQGELQYINGNAFFECYKLKNINFPETLTQIGHRAFESCESLTEIHFPETLTTISYNAFKNCEGLTEIHIPAATTLIDHPEAFGYCENLSTITVDENNPVYHSSGNCIIETETKKLILGCKNSVIPADGSVTTVGYGSFVGMIHLKEIDIPASVERIEISAFLDCMSLEKVTLREGLEYIGQEAFAHCNIKNIEIPNSVTSFGRYVFSGCPLEYNIHEGICYLGNRSNPYLVLIGPEKKTEPSIVVPPATVKIIAPNAFDESRVTEVYLPDGVIQIGSYAFSTPTLQKIRIPDSVVNVSTTAFGDAPITLLGTLYEGAYYVGNENNPYLILIKGKDMYVRETVIHEQTRIIFPYAFDACEWLEKVTLHENVESIVKYMFAGTAISELTIPSSVKYIEAGAFSGCQKLKNIYYVGTVEQWNAIEKDSDWNRGLGECTVSCTDGTIWIEPWL